MELELLVPVSQVSVSQLDTLVRQLAALLHVDNAHILLRGLRPRSPVRWVTPRARNCSPASRPIMYLA